jgi:thiol:disulfide interchange protein DsbD
MSTAFLMKTRFPMPSRVPTNTIEAPRFRRRALAALWGLLALLAFAAPAVAAPSCTNEDDLLAVEDAFVPSAEAAPGGIRIRWQIADGCYLYRHQIRVQADAGFAAQALQLPDGEAHEDEFFGRVETYRDTLVATLPGQARGDSTTLKVRFQGCADVGICYPPQTRNLTVALSGAAAAPVVAFGNSARAPLGGNVLAAPNAAGVDAAPLPPEQAFGFEAIAGDGNTLLLRFTPARGYYLYRDKTSLRLDAAATKSGFALGRPQWPQGKRHRDEHFGDVVVFFDQVDVPLPLQRTRADAAEITLVAGFQGCQTDGICYPPMARTVKVVLPAGSVTASADTNAPIAATTPVAAEPAGDTNAAAAGDGAPTGAPAAAVVAPDTTPANAANDTGEAEDSRLASALAGKDRLWTLLSFFGFGLLLAFTPCVLPMIPILSGLIAGHGPGLGAGRAFSLSFVYVLANALVFTVAGVVAGLVGANLQIAFQTPWVIVAFALLFIALALSSFGLYEMQLPAALRSKLGSLSDQQRGGSWLGVAVMGALSALIVGPCVAPPLAAAVLYIGQTQDPVFGGAALFLLAMGMGVPLLAFGVAAGKGLPTSGPWMVAVQRAFGFVFLGLAVWMVARILPAPATLALWAALLIGAAAMLGLAVARPGQRDGVRALGWVLVALLGVTGVAQAVGALAGSRDPLQPLAGLRGGAPVRELAFRKIKSLADLDREIAAAQAAGKPLLLDFYADWCVACKEMERYTFPDPAVQAALADFILLKADVTANDDVDQALMKRLGIVGPPATLYYVDGRERRDLRLFGFEKAPAFIARSERTVRR